MKKMSNKSTTIKKRLRNARFVFHNRVVLRFMKVGLVYLVCYFTFENKPTHLVATLVKKTKKGFYFRSSKPKLLFFFSKDTPAVLGVIPFVWFVKKFG